MATIPTSPAATIQPPNSRANSAMTAPNTVIRGNVRSPGIPKVVCCRCNPTRSPSNNDRPSC